MNLLDLPHDIIILIFEKLQPAALASLAQTCATLYQLVTHFGWSCYLRTHPRPSCSLSHARARWSTLRRVQYDATTDKAWACTQFVARPLSQPWAGKLSPLLAISKNRLIVASGNTIYSYLFGAPNTDDHTTAPSVTSEASFSLAEGHRTPGDIRGITLGHSDGFDDIFFVAFQDGIIEHVKLITATPTRPAHIVRRIVSTLSNNDFSECLSSAHHLLLSLSSNGSASLANHRDASFSSSSPLTWSSTIDLKGRGWASHLSLSSSTPYAAFGTSQNNTPLAIYNLLDGQFTASAPSLLLSTGSNSLQPSSAVYGLSQAPPSAPWGSSPQILVAGWFDSKVRCYDLRTPSCSIDSTISCNPNPEIAKRIVPILNPVLSLYNPWSYEPIFSVSCGGGSGSYIAAGSARHSVLSFWDIRAPREGWSAHAPGNDPSPVYSVILESSRCFGATESRPFVYDFGPGVTINTYPPIIRTRGDKLRPRKSSGNVNYYVTKYLHSRGLTSNEH